MHSLSLVLVLAGWILAVPPWAGLAAQQRRAPNLEDATDSTAVFELILADGTTLIGRIILLDPGVITIRTVGGLEVTVRRDDVVGVRRMSGSVQRGEFWEDDLSDSRLFLGPTARVPPSGRGYVGIYELFFPSFGVGLADVGMISGGMSLLPGVDLNEQLFFIAPKVRFVHLANIQMSAGVFWIKPGTEEESAGMVFGNLTGGNRNTAVTVGLGYPFASNAGFADDPLLMVGGEIRVSRSLKLITENWGVPGADGALLSFGVRIITRRLTVEAGAVTSTDGGALPIVSFSATW